MENGLLPFVNGYRLNKFTIHVIKGNGWILYNTTTGGIVVIDDEEDFVKSLEELKRMYFYVPNEFDEVLWVNKLRETKSCASNRKCLDGFTVFTTMDCNARCFYCYEKGQPQFTMTEQTSKDVAAFIIKYSMGKPIRIRWFGGEPLLNTKSIDIICNELNANGVKYKSSMISNGLLFDDSLILKAIDLWNLRNVQITLDGTKNVYQKAKAYKDAVGNEFERVISNIKKVSGANIRVSIRLNQDFYNTQDLLELADFLYNEFKGNKHVSVYNNWLYDKLHTLDANLDAEKYAKFKELQNKLIECGLSHNYPLRDKLMLNHCMADSDSSVIITPSGNVGKCEHYTTKYLIGDIHNVQFEKVESLGCKDKYQPMPKCFECPLYPQCVRIKMCPEERESCTLTQCENKIELIKQALLRKYKSRKQSN